MQKKPTAQFAFKNFFGPAWPAPKFFAARLETGMGRKFRSLFYTNATKGGSKGPLRL